jgi:dTDP-4-dehydrorhamnose 3,5-epimerase
MKVTPTEIKDVLIIEPDIFHDNRGYFFESYSEKKYAREGIMYRFVQDNISRSAKGALRGLHYQVGDFAQGKLCQVLQGSVIDVAVDIRFGSPTFGKYVSVELSEENHKQIWIPPGFAHGFSVLSEDVIFSYKCTEYYSKQHERCIIFNDSELNIDWKIDEPKVSEKDLQGMPFKNIPKDFIY